MPSKPTKSFTAKESRKYPELYLQVADPTVRERRDTSDCRGIARATVAERVAPHIHSTEMARLGQSLASTGALGYIVLTISKNLAAATGTAAVAVSEARPANAPSRTSGREHSASSTSPSRQAEPRSHRPSMHAQSRSSSTSSRKVSFAPDDAKSSNLSSSPHANQRKPVPSSRSHSPESAVFGAMQVQMRYVKETEGRRMKSERLRQKNALLFAERSMWWMAISQAVTLAFVAVVAIAVLKG